VKYQVLLHSIHCKHQSHPILSHIYLHLFFGRKGLIFIVSMLTKAHIFAPMPCTSSSVCISHPFPSNISFCMYLYFLQLMHSTTPLFDSLALLLLVVFFAVSFGLPLNNFGYFQTIVHHPLFLQKVFYYSHVYLLKVSTKVFYYCHIWSTIFTKDWECCCSYGIQTLVLL